MRRLALAIIAAAIVEAGCTSDAGSAPLVAHSCDGGAYTEGAGTCTDLAYREGDSKTLLQVNCASGWIVACPEARRIGSCSCQRELLRTVEHFYAPVWTLERASAECTSRSTPTCRWSVP